jgi:hypothetical protein
MAVSYAKEKSPDINEGRLWGGLPKFRLEALNGRIATVRSFTRPYQTAQKRTSRPRSYTCGHGWIPARPLPARALESGIRSKAWLAQDRATFGCVAGKSGRCIDPMLRLLPAQVC